MKTNAVRLHSKMDLRLEEIELPEILNGVIKCKNPRCITSTEHSLPQRFRLTDPSGPVYRCVWCEARAKTDFDNK